MHKKRWQSGCAWAWEVTVLLDLVGGFKAPICGRDGQGRESRERRKGESK